MIDIAGKIIDGPYAAVHMADGQASKGNPMRGMDDQLGAMRESGFIISKVLLGEDYELI